MVIEMKSFKQMRGFNFGISTIMVFMLLQSCDNSKNEINKKPNEVIKESVDKVKIGVNSFSHSYFNKLLLKTVDVGNYDKFVDDMGLVSFNLPKSNFIVNSDSSIYSKNLNSIVNIFFSETSQVDAPDAIWKKSDLSNAMKQGIQETNYLKENDWIVISGINKSGNIVYRKGFYYKPEDNYAGENGRNTQPWCQTIVIELEYPTNQKEPLDKIISEMMKSVELNFEVINDSF